MKRILGVLLVPFLLCGCSAQPNTAVSIQTQYGQIATAELTADIVAYLGEESRDYTIECVVDGRTASVTVTKPESLAGITAKLTDGGLSIIYDGTSLSAGNLSDVCPANCLPYLLTALSNGYLLEQSKEEFEGTPCYRLTLDTTAASGQKVVCTVWVEEETLLPRYAEFSQNGSVVLSVTLTEFRCTLTEE